MCPHLPIGNETRVNGKSVSTVSGKKVELLTSEDRVKREHITGVISRARALGLDKLSMAKDRTPQLLALQEQIQSFSDQGKGGKNVSSPLTARAFDVRSIDVAVAADPMKAEDGEMTPDFASLLDEDDDHTADAQMWDDVETRCHMDAEADVGIATRVFAEVNEQAPIDINTLHDPYAEEEMYADIDQDATVGFTDCSDIENTELGPLGHVFLWQNDGDDKIK